MKRLRISHVVVQPVLVYDDGEELSPGPEAQPFHVPLAELAAVEAKLRADLAEANDPSEPDDAA